MSSATVVRRQPRSKGCKQCISRHVKCDERAGCCRQCARFGLPCSGPIRGAVFLDMTEKASRARKPKTSKKKKEETKKIDDNTSKKTPAKKREAIQLSEQDDNSRQANSEPENSSSPATVSSISSGSSIDQNDLPIIPDSQVDDVIDDCFVNVDDYLVDPAPQDFKHFFYHPSEYHAVTIPLALDPTSYKEYCFIGQFVELISSSRSSYSPIRQRSWLFDLPDLIVTTPVLSLKYSIRAAALIYHAIAHRNNQAGTDAVQWYLAGMESYRATILGGSCGGDSALVSPTDIMWGSRMPYVPDSKAICVPMMFSFFEAMQGITTDAEMHHHTAAAEMLEARGPEMCIHGMEHGMLRSLRAMEAFHSIMLNRPAKFSSIEWRTIPFQQSSKIRYDSLIDILLCFTNELHLPRINQPGATLRDSIHRIHDLSRARKDIIEAAARSLIARLEEWWLDFEKEHQEIISPGSSLISSSEPSTALTSPSSILPLCATWMLANKETLAAGMVSLYSAAHIVLRCVLLIISLSKPPVMVGFEAQSDVAEHQAAIAMHSVGVFNSAMYLNTINPFCGDTVRTIFSIRIVSLLSLEDSHRNQAEQLLRGWGFWGHGHNTNFDGGS